MKLLNYINSFRQMRRNTEELVWAEIFHDAVRGSEWLEHGSLSLCPGRMAVGYNYLYPMFRILDEFRPRNILEMGLGQSSKMIARYAGSKVAGENCKYTIIEHDKEWSSFFQKRNPLPSCATIKNCDLEVRSYSYGGKKCQAYQYNANQFDTILNTSINGGGYDLISIDAPFGSDVLSPYVFSRVDIVRHIPNCLAESFCIIIDDYERKGERNTAIAIMSELKKAGIKYCNTGYFGIKGTAVIVSENLKFLCSL